jgi:hypothetical protein
MQKGQNEAETEARGWVEGKLTSSPVFICAYSSHICYLLITLLCVQVINKPCVRRTGYMRLISWIHHHGGEQVVSLRQF